MKGFAAGLGVGLLMALGILAIADPGAPVDPNAGGKKPQEVSLRGEIIDLTCYLAEGKQGRDHWKQAQACVKAGTPAALLTFDGKLYVITPHAREGYEPLKHVGEKVQIVGTAYERDGVRALVAKECKKLPPYAGEGEEGRGGDHNGGDKK